MSSIYIAGSSADVARAARNRELLLAHGLSCTSSWIDKVAQFGGNPVNATPTQQRTWSTTDLYNVRSSSLVWFLLPETRFSHGAFCEFGFALGNHIPVIISGQPKWRSIFLAQAYKAFDTDEEAYEWIRKADDLPILRRHSREVLDRPSLQPSSR